MPRRHKPYDPEFRARMVELVRAGRSPQSLAEEFEPTARTIRSWLTKTDLEEGRRARRGTAAGPSSHRSRQKGGRTSSGSAHQGGLAVAPDHLFRSTRRTASSDSAAELDASTKGDAQAPGGGRRASKIGRGRGLPKAALNDSESVTPDDDSASRMVVPGLVRFLALATGARRVE